MVEAAKILGTGTRAEHIELCRQRALIELDADQSFQGILNAMSSLTQDLPVHPETSDSTVGLLATRLMTEGRMNTHEDARRFIADLQ